MTILYVSVLAFVCVIFSGFIYSTASNEIDRTSRRQVVGFRNMLGNFFVDEAESERLRLGESTDAKKRLKINLFLVNLIVIGSGAGLCYVFAKKTLKPIEESVKAQERFTSDASHELRTPLASMKTEIEVSLRDSKLTISEAKELLKSNLEEVDNMHVMTENLLLLARHREVGETRLTDIAKLVKSTAKKHEQALKKASMVLVVETSAVKLITNPAALSQILGILIDNAIKYAGAGSTLFMGNVKDDGQAIIYVRDNGKGLDQEQLNYIFERFYKADSSRTASRSSGHGLGLSIAKQLTSALNGTIAVAKGPDSKGVEFRITLPLV
jgi:signal transduction histidine kinase